MHGTSDEPETDKFGARHMNIEIGDGAQRRTLLIVASRDSVSDTHALAIQAECPWIAVEQVETVDEACRHFQRPVSLILIDAFLLDEAEAVEPEFARFHPDARGAVIEADGRRPRNSIADVMACKLVQGVLPMNVPLDVWLSVVRLMLRGGEFFPAEMLYAQRRQVAVSPPSKPGPNHRAELTRRELEVLELVSRGLQNKSIAAELNLSEHTIKIHLHNIISKLRAHNRTEAAAWYRDHGPRADVPARRQDVMSSGIRLEMNGDMLLKNVSAVSDS